MNKFIEKYNAVMVFLGMVCLITFTGAVTLQIFSRIFLPKTPSWTEELSRYAFIYMVSFGCSVAVRKNEFVGVDIFTSMLPTFARDTLKICVHILLGLVSTFLLIKSVLGFAIIEYRMLSTAMQVPMQYVYFSMIILFATLILSFAIEVILSLSALNSNQTETLVNLNKEK